MHTRHRFIPGLLLAASLTAPLLAQTSTPTQATSGDSTVTVAQLAQLDLLFQLRATAFQQILGGTPPATALSSMETSHLAGQRTGQGELAYGWAAIDVGMRLISGGKPDLAEQVFRIAEVALVKACGNFDDTTESRLHAQAYQALAYIRKEYLANYLGADDALTAAVALDPTDPNIKAAKANFDNQFGPSVKAARQNPTTTTGT